MCRRGQSFAVSCTLWAVLQLASASAAPAGGEEKSSGAPAESREAKDPEGAPGEKERERKTVAPEVARAQSADDETLDIKVERLGGDPPRSEPEKSSAAELERPLEEDRSGGEPPEPAPAASGPRPGDAQPTAPPIPPAIRLDFEGGSLREFLDTVEQAVRETPWLHCNVAVNDPAAAELVKLPRIAFEQTSVDAAMQVAGLVAGTREFVITIDRLAVPDEHPTFIVLIDRVEKELPAAPRRKLEVLSLTDLFGDDPVQQEDDKELQSILAAIELALDLRNPGEESSTEVRFHAESRLLLVNGREDEIEVVSSVVTRVLEDRSSERQRRELAKENEQLRAQLERLKSRLQTQDAQRLRTIDELETTVVKLEADLAAVQRQADQSREYYEKARRARDAAYEKLVAQNVELKADIASAERIVAELTKQVAELKKRE